MEQNQSSRRKRRSARRRQRRLRIAYLALFLFALFSLLVFAGVNVYSRNNEKAKMKALKEAEIQAEEQQIKERRAAITTARTMAENYDYDGAISLLESQDGYDTDQQVVNAIAELTAEKSNLYQVDVEKVPHIFFHSLIIDTSRAFDESKWGADEVAGINAWMTTATEFDEIMQEMYDNGYVLVRLRDLVKETTDDDGTVHFVVNTSLKLPEGKKPFVLSIDDWSYYHTYTGRGYGEKAVLDENGDVKVQYTDANGKTDIGDYDVVPRLNSFIEKHPDFSYKGARGLIAMTGYNGLFGYRTDVAYKTGENLTSDQKEWLSQHPDFDWDQEVAEAKKIADAVKEEGWEFASHTWGHLSVTGKSAEALAVDNEKWQNTVANITGPVDTIIFAHGNDIGDWRDYDASTNEVYAYYNSQGFHFYCNVDASSEAWVQIRDGYVRQGRIDCDGLQMWRALSGTAKKNVFEQLFDVKTVFSKERPTPVSATGKA